MGLSRAARNQSGKASLDSSGRVANFATRRFPFGSENGVGENARNRGEVGGLHQLVLSGQGRGCPGGHACPADRLQLVHSGTQREIADSESLRCDRRRMAQSIWGLCRLGATVLIRGGTQTSGMTNSEVSGKYIIRFIGVSNPDMNYASKRLISKCTSHIMQEAGCHTECL